MQVYEVHSELESSSVGLFAPAEILALADRLREGWRPGSQIMPWLRDNAERLAKLNREKPPGRF